MMMKAVVFLLFVAGTLAKPNSNGRVVGGVETGEHEFPFVALIRLWDTPYCVGSIVSEDFIVTAAHCAQGDASSYKVIAGDHNISWTGGAEQERQVIRIIKNPEFGSQPAFLGDIALMEVSPSFDLQQGVVETITLAPSGFNPTATGVVMGWGETTEGGSPATVLQKATVNYHSDDVCRQSYGDSAVHEKMACYGQTGTDFCRGDSGAPLVCGEYLCGLASWGHGCGREGYPSVYTEVSYYSEWAMGQIVPREEDPEPIVEINQCGGYIDSTSAFIRVSLTAGQKCTWASKVEWNRIRMQKNGPANVLVSNFNNATMGPGQTVVMSNDDTDYTFNDQLLFIYVDATEDMDIGIVMFASGFSSSVEFDTLAVLTNSTAQYSHPVGGGSYGNNERSVFVVAPSGGAPSATLTYTRMDVEGGGNCPYDKVSTYSWSGSAFTLASEACGTTLPPPVTANGGMFIVTFTTDSSVTNSGFTFQW